MNSTIFQLCQWQSQDLRDSELRKRILFIDDDSTIQLIVRTCLRIQGGWEVLTATSGEEGLAIASAEHPDAILLDSRMPGMDGVTCLNYLQSNPRTKDIPVIFFTVELDLTERSRFQALGAVGAIAKPFDPLHLVSTIQSYLGWNHSRFNS
jgi:CheY-like chemotaxis protein